MSINHVFIITTDLRPFSFVLQEGVGLKVDPGCTLKQLIRDSCGISSDYIEERVKTAFINQKPVDNFDTAIVHDQDTIGLSGAMPGLVGATLRKNSVLSPFRSSISYLKTSDNACESDKNYGTVTLKLFNLLIKEIGPTLLKKGVLIQGELLKKILETEGSKKESVIKAVMLNSQKQQWNIGNIFWNINKDKTVLLEVKLQK